MIGRVRCECGANLFFAEVNEAKEGSVLRCGNCHKTIQLGDSLPIEETNGDKS